MLIPDLGSALVPLTEDTPDDVGEWPAEASRQPQGQGGREKEMARVFEPVRQHVVRAMKCGGAPSHIGLENRYQRLLM